MSNGLVVERLTWEQHRPMLQWASENCTDGWNGQPSGGYLMAMEMMRDPSMARDMVWRFANTDDEVMFRLVWL